MTVFLYQNLRIAKSSKTGISKLGREGILAVNHNHVRGYVRQGIQLGSSVTGDWLLRIHFLPQHKA